MRPHNVRRDRSGRETPKKKPTEDRAPIRDPDQTGKVIEENYRDPYKQYT